MARLPSDFRLVHLHGFSRKSILLTALARLQGRRVLVKLTSYGDDDAASQRARGGLTWRAFRAADAWVAVSPAFRAGHDSAGLPRERLHEIPNGVDLGRFQPASRSERSVARGTLGIPERARVLLCVGFFSRDKRPDLLLEAFLRLPAASRKDAHLLFVGATESRYHEIDSAMAQAMRARAAEEGVAQQVSFQERVEPIEPAYRAADALVLPSLREGLPNVLLEAMACGLACVASRLPGSTDQVVEDGQNGLLFPPGDPAALSERLDTLLTDPEAAARLGETARRSVEQRYSIEAVAEAHLALYRSLGSG
jgi:glycosyltransferase involved in cell wall biosynthesis